MSTKKKVLIVEDDFFIAEIYATKLSKEGFDVETVMDGEAAISFLSGKNLPDLILLDLLMPKISGIEVLKSIKSKDVTKNIPVVVLTNAGDKKYVSESLDLGADDYLIKSSYTPDEVVEKIKENIR